MKKKFYVYALIDPRHKKGNVFYIGKGTCTKSASAERNQIHLRRCIAGKHYNAKLQNKIKKILKRGLVYGVEFLFSTANEQECLDKEMFYIAFFGRKTLTNLTDGGEGISGLIRTESHKAKISTALMGNSNGKGSKGNKGQHHSKESAAKISGALKGRPAHNKGIPSPYGTGAKISAALKGRVPSPEHRRNISLAKTGKSNANKDRPLSKEHRAALSVAKTGKITGPHSKEHNAKISASLKGRIPWNKGKSKLQAIAA
jgi:hypothetical protein